MLRPCPWSGVSGRAWLDVVTSGFSIIPLVLPCSSNPVEGFRERMDSGGW